MANQHRLEIGATVKDRDCPWSKNTYTIVGEIYWGYDNDGFNAMSDLRRKPARVLTLVDNTNHDSVIERHEDEIERA